MHSHNRSSVALTEMIELQRKTEALVVYCLTWKWLDPTKTANCRRIIIVQRFNLQVGWQICDKYLHMHARTFLVGIARQRIQMLHAYSIGWFPLYSGSYIPACPKCHRLDDAFGDHQVACGGHHTIQCCSAC